VFKRRCILHISCKVDGDKESEGRWGVNPRDDSRAIGETAPPMSLCTPEIKGITRLKNVVFDLVEPHFQLAFQHVEESFALVPIRTTGTCSRGDSYHVRFHKRSSEGE
jgi:hypothetical protein